MGEVEENRAGPIAEHNTAGRAPQPAEGAERWGMIPERMVTNGSVSLQNLGRERNFHNLGERDGTRHFLWGTEVTEVKYILTSLLQGHLLS